MKINRCSILAFLLLAAFILSACSLFATEPQPVTFTISIPAETFSSEAEVRISLWDEDQLAASEEVANCAISLDVQTGEEVVQCPQGVDYVKVDPETYLIPVSDLTQPLTLTSESILTGEKYRIAITGLSPDNCNNASAWVEETARSAEISLENLSWATTEMACP